MWKLWSKYIGHIGLCADFFYWYNFLFEMALMNSNFSVIISDNFKLIIAKFIIYEIL